MRVAIAGAGNVGLFIANDLAETGHEVLLIEQDPTCVEPRRCGRAAGVEWLVADACEVSVAARGAGSTRCDVVVAATGDDEDNLVDLAARQAGVRACPASSPG